MIQIGGGHKEHPFGLLREIGLMTERLAAHDEPQPFLVHFITHVDSLVGSPLANGPEFIFLMALAVILFDQEKEFFLIGSHFVAVGILAASLAEISHTNRIVAAGSGAVGVDGTPLRGDEGAFVVLLA